MQVSLVFSVSAASGGWSVPSTKCVMKARRSLLRCLIDVQRCGYNRPYCTSFGIGNVYKASNLRLCFGSWSHPSNLASRGRLINYTSISITSIFHNKQLNMVKFTSTFVAAFLFACSALAAPVFRFRDICCFRFSPTTDILLIIAPLTMP